MMAMTLTNLLFLMCLSIVLSQSEKAVEHEEGRPRDLVIDPKSSNEAKPISKPRTSGTVPMKPGPIVSKKKSKSKYRQLKKAKEKSARCAVHTVEDLHAFIDMVEEEEKVNLFEFSFTVKDHRGSNNNNTNTGNSNGNSNGGDELDPWMNTTGRYYKPWQWYTTRSRHGRTLLMLGFQYDILSMNILTIGIKHQPVVLEDSPPGCFSKVTTSYQVDLIRQHLLGRSREGQKSFYGKSSREEYACNQEIMDNGHFAYNCCMKDMDGKLKCSTQGDDLWINILYFAITVVKIMMFLFCPKFLPQNLYSATYAASEYVLTLKKELKMKIFISEQTDANVQFKNRVTLEDICDWWKFRESLDSFPTDEIVPIKMKELRIKVKGKRIIPENEPPTGLMRTMYDNLFRCKIKNLDPFKECCETSIYAGMEPKFRHNVTWHMCVKVLVKAVLLMLIPIPYYIRLIVYFQFEHDEMTERRAALDRNRLHESFNFYKTNAIQYLSPMHGIFIATYTFYILCGCVVAFSDQAFRERLKGVARHALADMNAVSRSGVMGIVIRTLTYPFKRCGLLAFLVAPIYLICVLPFCITIMVIYCIPTIYLTLRLPFHAKNLTGSSADFDEHKKKRLKRVQKLGRKISKMDKSAHHGQNNEDDESCLPSEIGCAGFSTVLRVCTIIISCIFCQCILYSLALVFAESIGLFVEVMAFTMMGVIVNAGSVLKYVSMVLLVFVYMNDCYSNVYENYLTFNKTISDDMIDRTTADLRKIASMPSSMQANNAFTVKCIDEEKELTPSLSFDKKTIQWRLGQLLLFLDSYDTPRIPLRFFKRLCEVRVYGAPGPVYINLLAATGKFMIIVMFLMFVMIVVMAFGNVYQMSSTNTTLATLAGGFVPMLLKNVLSSKGAKLSLKSISFKGQIDEIIDEYKQYWPVLDLIVERDEPEEEVTSEETEVAGAEGGPESGEDGLGPLPCIGKATNAIGTPDKSRRSSVLTSISRKESVASIQKGGGGGGGGIDDGSTKSNCDNSGIGDSIDAESTKKDEDDGKVDLFIDLSVADTAGGWSLMGSLESVRSERVDTLAPVPEQSRANNNNKNRNKSSLLPPYFNPDKINGDTIAMS